jgi:hypothetical protein
MTKLDTKCTQCKEATRALGPEKTQSFSYICCDACQKLWEIDIRGAFKAWTRKEIELKSITDKQIINKYLRPRRPVSRKGDAVAINATNAINTGNTSNTTTATLVAPAFSTPSHTIDYNGGDLLQHIENSLYQNLADGVVHGDRYAQKIFLDALVRNDKIKRKNFGTDEYKLAIKQLKTPPPREWIKQLIKELRSENVEDEEITEALEANIEKLTFFYHIGYLPHAKQLLCHLSPKRFKIVAAGARAGKSMLAGAELAYLLIFVPGAHIWCVSSKYDLADKEFDWAMNFLATIKIRALDDLALSESFQFCNPKKGSRSITTPWASWVETKSSTNPDSLLGEEIDLIVMGEASQVQEEAWSRFLRPRLGPRKGKLLAISTPSSDSGLFMKIFNCGKSESEQWADWASWQFATDKNPYFSKEEYEIARKEVDEKIFKEQYEGLFVSRRGFVFCNIDHIVTKKAPEGFESLIGMWTVRYGYNVPTSALLFFFDAKKNKYFFYKEIYLKNATTESIIIQMKELSKGLNVQNVICDKKDYTMQDALKKSNIKCVINNEKQITETVAITKKMLYSKLLVSKEKVEVSSECRNLIRELKSLQWREASKGQQRTEEQVRNEHLHSPLAMANAIAFWDSVRGIDVYSAQLKNGEKE